MYGKLYSVRIANELEEPVEVIVHYKNESGDEFADGRVLGVNNYHFFHLVPSKKVTKETHTEALSDIKEKTTADEKGQIPVEQEDIEFDYDLIEKAFLHVIKIEVIDEENRLTIFHEPFVYSNELVENFKLVKGKDGYVVLLICPTKVVKNKYDYCGFFDHENPEILGY
ncbi:hypothetical protein ABK040_012046 [Willaertia magna]